MSSTNQDYRETYAYRMWSAVVRRLGKWCKCCTSKRSGHAHHIKKSADYPELRLVVENGVRLCSDCHRFLHVDLCGGYDKPCTEEDLNYFLKKFGPERSRAVRRARRYLKKKRKAAKKKAPRK